MEASPASGLEATHDTHPSADPNLYAIDVTVQRRALFPLDEPETSHVRYRRSAEWDVTRSYYASGMNSVWAKAADGEVGRVLRVSDQFTAYGPPAFPQGHSFGYGTSASLWNAGDTLDLDLGAIDVNKSVSFTLYYGVAPTLAVGQQTAVDVDADVSYLGYAEYSDGYQDATAIFAYRATTPTS